MEPHVTPTQARLRPRAPRLTGGALRCRRKFLRFFPRGFHDAKYVDWERGYKQEAHERWQEELDHATYRALLADGAFAEAASRAIRIESRTNLLFSFEKMALRDAVRSAAGARAFTTGLFDFLHERLSRRRWREPARARCAGRSAPCHRAAGSSDEHGRRSPARG